MSTSLRSQIAPKGLHFNSSDFVTNRQTYRWRGWCVDYGAKQRPSKKG